MSGRHRPRRPLRLRRLEDRLAPAAVLLPGRAFTDHEVLAYVRGTDAVAAVAGATGVTDVRVIFAEPGGALVRVGLAGGVRPETAVLALAARPGVEWSSPNYVYGLGGEFIPNDPLFGQQYAPPLIQAPAAWDTTTGSPGVIVAVADDGIALNHPDLAAGIWVNAKEIPGNGVDDDGNGFADDVNGWDFVEDDNSPLEENGDTHGTHVAGIIGARGNNGAGVAGLAGGGPNGAGVRIMPLRFVANGNGTGTAADAAAAFSYAANNGAKIINTSQSFDGFVGDPAVTAAVNFAYSKGVLFVNSAGNNNQLDPPRRAFTQVLFVAATDPGDVRTAFSNYGSYVDLAAPGLNVLSTVWDNNNTKYDYRMISGTSMAAPTAAGVAALVWSAHPTWTRDQVAAQIVGTADRIDEFNPGYANWLGSGRVNADRAVHGLVPPPRFGPVTGLPADGGFTAAKSFTISLAAPLKFDPATVSAADFELRGDGVDNIFGTADDTIVTLVLNANVPYQVGTDALNLAFSGNLVVDRYRFTAKASGLSDPFGQLLDGDGDGLPGGDFVRTFRVAVPSIQGRVYEDTNVNLLSDPGDPSLGGWTVYLDGNNNGVFDAGETGVLTDAAGSYAFLDLKAGTYTVRRVTPAGWTDNRPAAGSYTITLATGTSTSPGQHFGQLRSNAIYGRAYEDLNGDGVRDDSDPALPGRPVFVDVNGNSTLDAFSVVASATDVPVPVVAGLVSSSISVAGFAGALTDLDVSIDLPHAAVGDLVLVLVAPDGRRVELAAGVGGETNNFTGTIFDDEAAGAVTGGSAPYAGRFRPTGRLVDFDGLDPNGTWTLEVTDLRPFADDGNLTAWSLVLTTGEPQGASDINGNLLVTAVPAGKWTVRSPAPPGWRPAFPPAAAQPATVADGVALTEVNFGQYRQNAAYGRVYHDTNANGQADDGEPALPGWRTFVDRNGNGKFDAPVTTLASVNVPITTVNMGTITSLLTVGVADPITDLDVTLSITSPYTGELEATLIAPDGRRVLLFRHLGIDGNNYTNTTLDDEAATPITAANPPFTGRFRPQGSLAEFDGLIPLGLWRLEVKDLMQSYTGVLTAWSLTFETAEPTALSAVTGGYVIPNLPAVGVLRRVLQPGWGGTQPINDAYPFSVAAGDTLVAQDFGVRQGPARVASVLVNGGAAQRSRVTEVQVRFDRVVITPANPAQAFKLVRTGPGAPAGEPDGLVALTADLSGSTASQTVVRLTFSGPLTEGGGSLVDGTYQFVVLGSKVAENGVSLDGDGNGSAGGDFVFAVHRLFGDADGDRDVDAADFGPFRQVFGTATFTFDFDGDGDVDAADFGQFRLRFGTAV